MISRLEVLNYRCLRYIDQPVGRFQVLAGPNASGKTTFLDAIAFLSDLVSKGLETAVRNGTQDFPDLVWGRSGRGFQIAAEVRVPEERLDLLAEEKRRFSTVRYEVDIGADRETGKIGICAETVALVEGRGRGKMARDCFPCVPAAPVTILGQREPRAESIVKDPRGFGRFHAESTAGSDRGALEYELDPARSSLASLPGDGSIFPVSSWLKEFLTNNVQRINLNSLAMREPSPPGQVAGFRPDGSSLPWLVERLKSEDPGRFQEWLDHLRTAVPDLEAVRTVQRPENGHRYLVLVYEGGLEVPSWVASDGTLRLMALTVLAYLPESRGVYLVEEPENGLHPRAIEPVYQSLSSIYDGQVLAATQLPMILNIVDPAEVLCFAKTREGATDVVPGNEHPKLRDWHGEEGLGVYFAAGALG